ncbi:phage tail tape measure protein [Shinella sp. 838]|uniref:phage tail tape measure protein n=1 Tax=Shinella sp. 838 TaxID=3038164 RepID=UPI0024150F67|nr:phage tail tape measure protein [Shinella sp. 838]MDG4670881.1 phage tail tape measure protein [Shinella sp. 838]
MSSTRESKLIVGLIDHVSQPARRISGAISALNRQTSSMMAPFRGMIGPALALGSGYLGVTKGISSTVGAAMDFESAFADVKKVVNASDAQFEVMSRSIRKMSTELPMASTEIAALFAAAGESGIATNELQSFAEMASRVGIAFDMSAADAGESLAKLKTQFGLTVAETGDLADAVNHLSNNMASKSSEITTFLLKVGSLSEMAGFAKEEVAALGSAMIAAGAQPEVAATAMQNVAKKMTAGSLAKKEQRDVAKMLGLDLPTLSKEMQKDAPGAVKKVLKAISKQSKDKHISLLSGFFGDEAKAFAPLIANTELMDKALDSVADKSKYTGSAFREFTARADTTSNALAILRNKIAYVFEDIGLSWLPQLKAGIADFGHVLDTLDSRFTIFDEFKSRIGGFLSGLGATDGSDALKGIRDFIFGAEDAAGAADKYGRLFGQFQEYGKAVREFGKEIKDNPVVKFLSDLSPYYIDALKWSVGFLAVSAGIRKLASALWFLSGASTIVGALKALGGVATALGIGGGGLDKVIGAAGTSAGSIYGKAFGLAAKAAIIAGITLAVAEALQTFDPKGNLGGVTSPVDNWLRDKMGLPARDSGITPGELWDGFGNILPKSDTTPTQDRLSSVATDLGFRESPIFGDTSGSPRTTGEMLAGLDKPITLDGPTISQLLQPSRGVQEVREVNKQPPEIRLSVVQHITGVSSPEAAADAAASRLGQAVKSAVESSYSD